MKKIVITSNTSWFVFNFFRSSIVEFMKDGNEVYVLAPKDAYSSRLVELGCNYQEVSVDRSGARIATEVSTFRSLCQYIYRIQPDCVLNFTPKMNIYCTLAARLHSIKVVNSVAGLGSIFSEKGFKPLLGKALLRMTQPLAHHVVFQNPDDWKVYLDNKLVKRELSSRVHGIGINLKRFRPHPAPNDGVTRFILVARMLVNKGVVDFVNAAKAVDEYYQLRKQAGFSVPQYEFSLLGFVDEDNPQGIPLSQLEWWNDNTPVKFLGETDDVFAVVKEQDCVVLPSFYREGMPQCLIEACAMAKPIITTDNVGCRETIIDGETGLLVKPQSVPELKEAMISMIEMGYKKRLQLGRKGRKKAEKDFCHLKVSRHYLQVIESLI
ncbi:glycosyltransferase family 4 protein [Vibrio paucivorans]|uniref:Glycosyltransferase family 4 protein n=1 Tax=Vibrio paucivorans TaxID=2829489 RepID=A0A9X3CBW6_9VIBR|nr:glycosyltransferase family 4 protein [Vibrio paucivorans]MCW8332821.1 glycosyltransferase family 4 protein [Vibrio paucivorans]